MTTIKFNASNLKTQFKGSSRRENYPSEPKIGREKRKSYRRKKFPKEDNRGGRWRVTKDARREEKHKRKFSYIAFIIRGTPRSSIP